MAANALGGSRLDYCNSLFRSLSALDFRKLQCVRNSLAKIITVFITHVQAKLGRVPSGPILQYISLLSILASALLMMLQRFGMISFMHTLIQKEAQNLSVCTSISTLISSYPGFSPWR